MRSCLQTLTRLESECYKCISILQAAKTDIHALRSYFSTMEIVDNGIVIDENGGGMHTSKIIGDEICSKELVAKTVASAKSESLPYPPLKLVPNGQDVSGNRNGVGLEECIRFVDTFSFPKEDNSSFQNLMPTCQVRLLEYLRETYCFGKEVYATHKSYPKSKDGDGKIEEVVPEVFRGLCKTILICPLFMSVPKHNQILHLVHTIRSASSLQISEKLLVAEEFGAKRPEPKPPD